MKNYFKILRYVKPYWGYALLNASCNILSVLFSFFSLTLIAPFLDLLFLKDDNFYLEKMAAGKPEFHLSTKAIVDSFYYYLTEMITDPNRGKQYALMFICIAVAVMFFLKNLFRYLGQFFISPIRNGVVKDLRADVHKKMMRLPLSWFSNERKGDIITRVTSDVHEVEWSVMSSLEVVFRDPFNIFLFLGMMIFISAKLTVFVFILLPIVGFLIGRIGKSLKRTSARSKEKLGLLISIIEETLSGLRIIKAFNAEKFMAEKFAKVNERYNTIAIRALRKTDLSSPLSEFLGTVTMMIVMYFGGMLVLGKDASLSASAFITYIALFSQIIPPAKSFTQAFYNIQKGLASADRIFAVLEAEESIKDQQSAETIKSFNYKIEYQNISFSYRKGDEGYVLKNVSFTIEKGKTVALVGQSGSGKTTLADLLPRYYDVDGGTLLIDGTDIRKLQLHSLRELLGVVSQEPILFNDTIYNNIAFGMNHATEKMVEEAASVANAHEFITQMPEGYQTNIGDRGSKLSGGQRQRISIARAVLKNPPILILDEATSALDTESEKLVQDALTSLMKNRTVLVIAHRLSTIQHADEIIVLQKGEIVQRGTHVQLANVEGVYKKLYELQGLSS
ncbi:MAG TPA: ABC transporter ATP-binding protein [Bacteroidia bacterium]|nr:ABC transporter ATP-binding protein [Bacteroidia bacterium]MBP7713832.1 ABC transporter ATP-binding protein [Bacteroidia bacterium]MBP8668412.1 ABC transporter ATP-binding protein [Bacteroidia bacterium]HOZ83221.1 ABC transporter ATP-binding protein [Bacteroidia bacterium]HOZ90487.1 ABC transporter ATP-binding protein [Bacteroidia bacterium]